MIAWALAAAIGDGTIGMSLDPPGVAVCVAIPAGELAPGCDDAAAERVASMAAATSLAEGATMVFVASMAASAWHALFVVARTPPAGEMSEADRKGLLVKWQSSDPDASVHERRFGGVQVVDVIATPRFEGGARGYLATYVLAGKRATYIVNVSGTAGHDAELGAIADGALATLKLEPATPLAVTTTPVAPANDTKSTIIAVALGLIVLVLVGLGVRVAVKKDEGPPPDERPRPKKKSGSKRR